MLVSNRELVDQLKAGNRSGCILLVERFRDCLIKEATLVFHADERDAEEIVNDVLLVVVQRIGSFAFKSADSDFHMWVVTIFRNRMRDYVRRLAVSGRLEERFSEAGFDEDEQSGGQEVAAAIVRGYRESLVTEDNVDEGGAAQHARHLALIEEVLDSMESWERVLLRCRALDVPFEDIAGYTGKPVKQLKVYHGRVKQKFMKLLSERSLEFHQHIEVRHEA